MKRKLIKHGPTSLTISLPKEWTDRFNLNKGDEIDLEEIETRLIVSSANQTKKTETKIFDCGSLNQDNINEHIVGLYKAGIPDVKLDNIRKDCLKKIKQVVNNSIGWEIIEESKNSLRVLYIGSTDEETISKAENQIYWKIENMIEKVIENKGSTELIYEIDLEINRLSFFIMRNISLRFSAKPETFLRYNKVALLEEIGDSIRHYNEFSKKEKQETDLLIKFQEIVGKTRIFESKKENGALEGINEEIRSLKKKALLKGREVSVGKIFLKEVFDKFETLIEYLIAIEIGKKLDKKY